MNNKPSKEEIINQAITFHFQGNIPKAKKYYQYCINQGFKDQRVFSNYGLILQNVGKLKEAELSYHKAIQLNPNYGPAHYNLGNLYKDLGTLKEAENCYKKAIELNPDLAIAHTNLGGILYHFNKLKEAEKCYKKAIELNPDLAIAHANLGHIFKDLGQLKEAEKCYIKAIELNPDYAEAYYELSYINYSDKNKKWKDKLFSENILNNKSKKDKIDIYFARANILHKEEKFEESSKILKLANKLKLDIHPSNPDQLIKKSKFLLLESYTEKENFKIYKDYPQSIFIVGMPRSGSTLIESILSMNSDVNDLGEINILEESFLEWKKTDKKAKLTEIYQEKININEKSKITTNKWLYNYQYTGIIAQNILNVKIIYCFRHPLDNILSIYRSHFSKGNHYSSSLVDCAKVYLDHKAIMNKYKKRFRSNIHNLNYDLLVTDPVQEIKSLISWLGWEWNESFLSPHCSKRSVLTRSNIEVRAPINSKSIGGWQNYKEMLKPAMEVMTQNNNYSDLKY